MEPLVVVLVPGQAPTLFGGATWPSHLITDTHKC